MNYLKLNKLFVLYCLAIMVSFSAPSVLASTDQEMAGSAIVSIFRTADQDIISRYTQENIDLARQLSSTTSNDSPYGVVIAFSEGMSASGLEEFADSSELEIIRAESKFTVGSEGEFYTVSVGFRDIVMQRGPISERIERGVRHQRLFLASSSDSVDITMLSSPHRYYRIDAIGNIHDIASLADDPQVAAIIIDLRGALVESHQWHTNWIAEMVEREELRITRHEFSGSLPDEYQGIPVLPLTPLPAVDNLRSLVTGE